MNNAVRRTAVVVATLAAGTALVATPAGAAEDASSRITAHPSDTTVSSGQQFVVRGKMTSGGEPVSDATVRVLTYRHQEWVRLRGAVVSTRDTGRYRVRIVLSMKGDRILKVVGIPPQEDNISRSKKVFTVQVD